MSKSNSMHPKCPTCGKRAETSYAPFCCKRCADVDLARWFSGSYAVPTEETPEENAPAFPANDD